MAFKTRPRGTILITRPYQDAVNLAQKLTRLGFTPVIDSILMVEHIMPEQRSDRLLALPQACLLTSRNAAFALTVYQIPLTTPIFVVGDASAQVVKEKGYHQVITGHDNAASLLPKILDTLQPTKGTILHFCGTETRFNFAPPLSAAGYHYEQKVVYRTVPATAFKAETLTAFHNKHIDAVLFYSPKTARRFSELAVELKGDLQHVLAVCLSPAIADALHSSFAKTIIARHPNETALLQALNLGLQHHDQDSTS
jgi:uroporphyrinogen-III synthase